MTKNSRNHYALHSSNQNSGPIVAPRINPQLTKGAPYPLLQALLEAKGLPLLGTFTYEFTTRIFDCSVRALQERIRSGQLRKRNLPGRAKFLAIDLEDFLRNSVTMKDKFYTTDVWDSMQVWSNWAFRKGVSLDALGNALGCGQKIGHGMDVAGWWATRDLHSICEYCLQDCWVTYQVYCRLTYQQPLMRKPRPEPDSETISVAERSVPVGRNRRRPRRESDLLPVKTPA